MNKNTFEKILNRNKIYFKNIMPNNYVRKAILSTYTSPYIDLSEFKNKLYVDPIFGEDTSYSVVSFSSLNGDWLIDEETDDYGSIIIKFTDNKSGNYIKIAFPDQINKLKFLNEMHTYKPIKQENPGMNISDIVNNNVLYKKENGLTTLKVATTMLAITTGVGLLAFFRKK